jgi:Protein of unknown function (DUF3592)
LIASKNPTAIKNRVQLAAFPPWNRLPGGEIKPSSQGWQSGNRQAQTRRIRRQSADFLDRFSATPPEYPPVPPDPLSPEKSHTPIAKSQGGRWYLGSIGLIIALFGGLFFWLMARSFLRAYQQRSWPEVECVILASELDEKRHDTNSPTEFSHKVNFGYEWQGIRLVGDRFTLRGVSWSSKREKAEALLATYPVGKITTCRLDPAAPQSAVLKMDSLAPGYSIWFPSLFILGGLGITFRAVFPPIPQRRV